MGVPTKAPAGVPRRFKAAAPFQTGPAANRLRVTRIGAEVWAAAQTDSAIRATRIGAEVWTVTQVDASAWATRVGAEIWARSDSIATQIVTTRIGAEVWGSVNLNPVTTVTPPFLWVIM